MTDVSVDINFLLNGGLYQRMLLRCLFFRLAVIVGL